MLNSKTDRQRNVGMLLPEHHESRLAVPMGSEAALGTPEGSFFRLMHMPAFRTGATGAPFSNEARCDTRLFRLVSEVLLDPPGLHLGDLLPGFAAKPLLLPGVFLYTGRVADHQLADSVVDAPVDCLTGGFMEQVSDLGVGFAFEASFGPDQFLPAAASFGAAGKGTTEPLMYLYQPVLSRLIFLKSQGGSAPPCCQSPFLLLLACSSALM